MDGTERDGGDLSSLAFSQKPTSYTGQQMTGENMMRTVGKTLIWLAQQRGTVKLKTIASKRQVSENPLLLP